VQSIIRLEERALRAFCSGSHTGYRGARDNSRDFVRDTRATTEMPEMATTDQRLRCKCIILAGLTELAPPLPISGRFSFRIGRSRVIS